MNKKILAIPALTLCFSAIALNNRAFALEDCSSVTDATLLETCLAQGGEITLGSDIIITKNLEIIKNTTLNLSEHSVTAGAGSFANGIRGMFTVKHGAKAIINGAGTISTGLNPAVYAAISMTVKNTPKASADIPAELVVNNATVEGYYYGIAGNGTRADNDYRSNTSIEVNNSTISGLNTADSIGIFHPQEGILKITGNSLISGNTGLGLKGGSLILENGTIKGFGDYVASPGLYNNGMNMSGAALAVESNTGYVNNVKISILGGKLVSDNGVAFKEYRTNGLAEEPIKSLSIEGGNFISAADKDVFELSEDFTLTNFISGGTFSGEIASEFLAEGFYSEEVGGEVIIKPIESGEPEIEDVPEEKAPNTGVVSKETSAIKGIGVATLLSVFVAIFSAFCLFKKEA